MGWCGRPALLGPSAPPPPHTHTPSPVGCPLGPLGGRPLPFMGLPFGWGPFKVWNLLLLNKILYLILFTKLIYNTYYLIANDPRHLPNCSEHPSDTPRTLSGFLSLFPMNPKLSLVLFDPLVRYPTVCEQHRHDQCVNSINDHQRGQENHNDPCVFKEDMVVIWTITVSPIPFVTSISALVRDMIISIIILVWSRYRQGYSTHSVWFHPHDLVIRCVALWM
jgi:hypothetical protein